MNAGGVEPRFMCVPLCSLFHLIRIGVDRPFVGHRSSVRRFCSGRVVVECHEQAEHDFERPFPKARRLSFTNGWKTCGRFSSIRLWVLLVSFFFHRLFLDKVGVAMQTKECLDVDQFVDDDVDVHCELEFVESSPSQEIPIEPSRKLDMPDRANAKFLESSDHDLEEALAKYQGHLRSLPMLDPANLKKMIYDLEQEKRYRKARNIEKKSSQEQRPGKGFAENGDNGRPRLTNAPLSKRNDITIAKTDCSGRLSVENEMDDPAFSEELVIMNSQGKRPFNIEGSTLDGGKSSSRILSGDMAGPSLRQGLRSSSKHYQYIHGISDAPGNSSWYKKPSKRSSPYFSTEETPNRNSSPAPKSGRKGCLTKRARQAVNGGDTSEKVVELMSSEDEEDKETQDTVADCQIASQRRVHGTRSTPSPSIEGVRIAYPSRDDPEAVEVVYQDLHRLEPLEFLNDTVIDFYIKYIQRPEVLTVEDKNKFYFFNSFFYKKLSDIVGGQNKKNVADLSKLRKWTKGTNIFEKEYLFIPIHDKWHWSLAIVCHPGATSEDTGSKRCILHLDSMSPGHKSNTVFKLLRTYLVAEWAHQANRDGVGDTFQKLSSEDFVVKKIPVPQQENESDCGLFLLHYIEQFIKEAPAPFNLNDVDEGRLFGRNWFEPSQASDLRSLILGLLETIFNAETSRATENKKSERLSRPCDGSENLVRDIQNDNHCAVEVTEFGDFPGQSVVSELVLKHDTSATCFPTVDSSSGVSSPKASKCNEPQLSNDLRIDEEIQASSQGDCGDPRKSSEVYSMPSIASSRSNCSELPTGTMLGFSADFESCVHLGVRSEPLSGVSVDTTMELKMLHKSKSLNRDVGSDDRSGIPLVVDLPIQEE